MTSNQLRKKRLAAGRTIADQAIWLGLPKRTYENYERGARSVPSDMDRRFALAEHDFAKVAKLLKRESEEFGWDKQDLKRLAAHLE